MRCVSSFSLTFLARSQPLPDIHGMLRHESGDGWKWDSRSGRRTRQVRRVVSRGRWLVLAANDQPEMGCQWDGHLFLPLLFLVPSLHRRAEKDRSSRSFQLAARHQYPSLEPPLISRSLIACSGHSCVPQLRLGCCAQSQRRAPTSSSARGVCRALRCRSSHRY